MEIEKSLYIVKPQAISQDERLSFAEQDYLCLIWQLQNAKGCTAGNKWFGDYFGVSRQRASEVICSLRDKNIILSEDKRIGKNIVNRTITIIDEGIKKSFMGVSRKSCQGIKETPERGIKETPEDKVNSKSKVKRGVFQVGTSKCSFCAEIARAKTGNAGKLYGLCADHQQEFRSVKGTAAASEFFCNASRIYQPERNLDRR